MTIELRAPKWPDAAPGELLSSADPRQHLAQLYADYARLVAWFASRLLTRPDEVEDVVQEVFLIAASNLPGLTEPPKIRGWLKTVTLRRVGRRLRWARMRARLGMAPASSEAAEHLVADPQASPEDRAALRELLAILGDLPVELRIAWTLRHMHQESLEAVAELVGCSLATAKRRIAAAQERIQREIGDE
ncbi:MAG: sigma-70 family RNA polymerase sigma factor [Polyangiaceae bacterium]